MQAVRGRADVCRRATTHSPIVPHRHCPPSKRDGPEDSPALRDGKPDRDPWNPMRCLGIPAPVSPVGPARGPELSLPSRRATAVSAPAGRYPLISAPASQIPEMSGFVRDF